MKAPDNGLKKRKLSDDDVEQLTKSIEKSLRDILGKEDIEVTPKLLAFEIRSKGSVSQCVWDDQRIICGFSPAFDLFKEWILDRYTDNKIEDKLM